MPHIPDIPHVLKKVKKLTSDPEVGVEIPVDKGWKFLFQGLYQPCHAHGRPPWCDRFHGGKICPGVIIEVAPLDHVDVMVPDKGKQGRRLSL